MRFTHLSTNYTILPLFFTHSFKVIWSYLLQTHFSASNFLRRRCHLAFFLLILLLHFLIFLEYLDLLVQVKRRRIYEIHPLYHWLLIGEPIQLILIFQRIIFYWTLTFHWKFSFSLLFYQSHLITLRYLLIPVFKAIFVIAVTTA